MDINKFSREVSSLLGVIDTYKRWKNFDTRFNRKYEYYHPSEFGKCLRQQQYKHYVSSGLISVDFFETNSQKLRLFDKGHNMHERWVNYFDDIGNVLMGHWECDNILCNLFNDDGEILYCDNKEKVKDIFNKKRSRVYRGKNNSPIFKPKICNCGCKDFSYMETPVFSEDLKIAGSADIVLNFDNLNEERFKGVRTSFNKKFLPTKGSKIVIDMKTASSSSWKNQILRKGAHKEYIIQLIIYVHVLDANYGLILYENKDNSELYCYKVDRNKKWFDIIEWQVKEMIKMREDKTLPPPKAISKKDYMCKFCEFRSLCHSSAIWGDKDFNKKRVDFYKSLL